MSRYIWNRLKVSLLTAAIGDRGGPAVFPKSRLSPLKVRSKKPSQYDISARRGRIFPLQAHKSPRIISADRARGVADSRQTRGSETLRGFLADYRDRLNAQKRRRKLVDYSDLERMTAALLYDSDGKPSDTAKELRGRFEEICIDEYQDVNALQDRIFAAFARPGGKFMVGDVRSTASGAPSRTSSRPIGIPTLQAAIRAPRLFSCPTTSAATRQ